MSPTIFNIVCDAVIRHCERSMNQQGMKSIFYADDGVLIGANPAQLQTLLDIYTDGFERVGLQMNVAKTKTMIIEGQKRRGTMSESAYLRKTTGEGESFAERMKTKVTCPLCDTEVRSQYLAMHQQTRKCLELWRRKRDSSIQCAPTANESNKTAMVAAVEPTTYTVSVDQSNHTQCPVPGCPYATTQPPHMRRHFMNMHNDDTIIISEEGVLPRCTKCGSSKQMWVHDTKSPIYARGKRHALKCGEHRMRMSKSPKIQSSQSEGQL
jgi:Reverse transcriptase (RNA-dependent DNA polymerase)